MVKKSEVKLAKPEINNLAQDAYSQWLESSAGLYYQLQLGALASNSPRRQKRFVKRRMRNCYDAGQVILKCFDGLEAGDKIIAEAKKSRAQTILGDIFPTIKSSLTPERFDEITSAIVTADMENEAFKINSFQDHVNQEQWLIELASRHRRGGRYDYELMTTIDRIGNLVEFWHPRTIQIWLNKMDDSAVLSQPERELLETSSCRYRSSSEYLKPSVESEGSGKLPDWPSELGHRVLSLQ